MALVEDHFGKLLVAYPRAVIEQRPDGSALVRIPEFPLPKGWNAASTTVVFIVPVGYPVAKPDAFWADASLRLGNGGVPANASINANYGGTEPLLWFSYHANSWNPQFDDLLTYAKVILRRLSEAR
jgi:hypothetical protein